MRVLFGAFATVLICAFSSAQTLPGCAGAVGSVGNCLHICTDSQDVEAPFQPDSTWEYPERWWSCPLGAQQYECGWTDTNGVVDGRLGSAKMPGEDSQPCTEIGVVYAPGGDPVPGGTGTPTVNNNPGNGGNPGNNGGNSNTANSGSNSRDVPEVVVYTGPVFPDGWQRREIPETAQPDDGVGDPIVVDDAGKGSVTYSLSGVDEDLFDIDGETGQLTVADGVSFDYETEDRLVVRVSATDKGGDTAVVTVIITLVDIDEAPYFGEPERLSVSENALAGHEIGDPVVATDPEGDDIAFSLSGEESTHFVVDPTTGQLAVAEDAGLDFETSTSHTFTLNATDGENAVSVELTVYVTDANDAPVFSDANGRSVPENADDGDNVGDPITATDQDGHTLTYSISGDDVDHFSIDSSTAQISVSADAALDHETRPTLALTVTATDTQSASVSRELTVTVTDVDEAPVFADIGRMEVAENAPGGQQIGVPISAVDPEGDDITYSLTGSGAAFAIDAATGQLSLAQGAELDYETNPTYTFTVSATAGDKTSGASITVGVTDANESPTFIDSVGRSVEENAVLAATVGAPVTATDPDGDELTYALSGDGAAAFAIDTDTGQITVADGTALDHETSPAITLIVNATDPQGISVSRELTVNVTNVDEPPVFSDIARLEVAENAPAGLEIGVSITAEDPEDDAITYSLSGDGAGPFVVHTDTGQLAVGESAGLDYEAQTSHTLSVIAAAGGKTTSTQVTVFVTDANDLPSFLDTIGRSIPENATPGDRVDDPVTAADDDGDDLTYTLSGDGASDFVIDPATGQIAVAPDATLDHETRPLLTLIVTVTDAGRISVSREVTLTVTDVDEPPGPPGSPTLSQIDSSEVEAEWTAPRNSGPPIVGYEIEYRVHGDDGWESIDAPGGELERTLEGLDSNTRYEARVRATNDEGTGGWSPVGDGRTAIALLEVLFGESEATVEEGGTVTVTVTASPAADRHLRVPITLSHPNGDLGGIPPSVSFPRGSAHISFEVTVGQDDDDAEDDTVTLSFGELPEDVVRGNPAMLRLTIGDDDKSAAARMDRLNVEILGRQALLVMADINTAIVDRLEEIPSELDAPRLQWNQVGGAAGARLGVTSLTERDASAWQFLDGASFSLPLRTGGHRSPLRVWGMSSYQMLAASEGTLGWDGHLTGMQFGVDKELDPNVLAGLSVSWSRSDFHYDDSADDGRGAYESSIVSVHPYAGWHSSGGLAWGTVGYGTGDVSILDEGRARQSSDLVLQAASAGGRRYLAGGGDARWRVDLQGDATVAQVDVHGRGLIAADTVNVSRMRLALAGTRRWNVGPTRWITTDVELGARRDGGFMDDGLGTEIGGGVAYLNRGLGLTVEGRGRVLLGGPVDEWGLQGLVRVDPGSDSLGLSMLVQPAWGAVSGGVHQLWREGLASVGADRIDTGGRLSAQLGYGLFRWGGVVTPYAVYRGGALDAYQVGGRYEWRDRFSIRIESERLRRLGRDEDAILLQALWRLGEGALPWPVGLPMTGVQPGLDPRQPSVGARN